MTQDQYGQARDSGYVDSGQVVEDDQTENFSDGEEKKMTTFQKVASALRGDRADRDAPDQDVPENAGTTGQTPAGPDDRTDPNGTAPDPYGTTPDPDGAAVDPDGMATGQTSQDTYTPGAGTPETFTPGTGAPDTVAPGTGTHETFARDGDTQDTVGQDTGAFGGQDPNGAGSTRGDYWDVPDARGTAQDQADEVTSPDRTPVDTGTDPLSHQDTANAEDPTVTQPDVYDADAAPTDAGAADAYPADAATDAAAADAGATGAGATSAYPADAADTTAATPQGAATISDVPVTQTSEDAAAANAGRHAAPVQELHPGEAAGLHPGEAAGSLDDLGDLAYGKLIPDAADFTAQWQEIQFKFVDDPQASVTEAAAIVEQVTTKMEAAIQERQRAIAERQQAIQEQQRSLRGRWGEGAETDTETLRATLRMYKAFLDQLVGPKV